jgi:hypothetical protein
MFGEHIHASRVVGELPTLWLNPWAQKAIAEQLPFETHTAGDNGAVYIAAEATSAQATIFALAPNWPGFTQT